jgi:hypothetical protein
MTHRRANSLKDRFGEERVEPLRQAIEAGIFPGITFRHAMEFILTDGIMPASGLPVASFFDLEDWVLERGRWRR